MGIKESLKTAIYPLYEELEKIEQDQSYTTFCVQWGEKIPTRRYAVRRASNLRMGRG